MRTPLPRPCLSFLLLIPLLAAPTSAAAQRDRTVVGGQVGYARTGITTNTVAGDDEVVDRQGAFVGLFLRTRLFRWVSLQPEIDLTVKGGSFPQPDLPGVQIAVEFGYLEFPLLVRFAPSLSRRGRGFRPVAFGGASAGVRLGCSITVTESVDSLTLVACTQSLRAVDWSWVVGGGVQWNLKGVSLGLEGRYMKAFTSFSESELDPKNHLFAILLVLTI